MENKMEAIICSNVNKSYGKKEVLKNIDFTLEKGKIYGLIGRNGAGKTTLLSILSAQNPATEGNVTWNGEKIWENRKALDHICFSRELSTNLYGSGVSSLKVKEYLKNASYYYPNWDQKMADELIEKFELNTKQRINKMSKGMLSMVTIIVALASKADFTFLDEPVAGLDVVMREYFYRKLMEAEKADELDQKAVDNGLVRENGTFKIIKGSQGVEVNVEKSIAAIENYVSNDWDGQGGNIELTAEIVEPKGSEEELSKVKDLLGGFNTNYSSSTQNRCDNIATAAGKINGTVLYPGEEFSVYETIGPLDAANGYELAGAYENGQTVQSYGGGVCQVSTTLYNAVILAELEVTERSNHSMIVTYVKPSMDAAIAGDYKDLKFVNNQDVPIYIEGYTSGKNVYFNIYGEETRPANRKVTYESEVVSEQDPGTQFVATGDPVGTMSVSQGKHVGYVAQLWKVVTVDGVEESREVFNKSTYKASPKIVNVGTASEDPNASATIGAALATGDEGTIYAAVAQFTAAAAATPEQPAENQSAEEQAIVGDGQVDVSGDNGGNGQ